jgi:AcrR family transcriptional regulator
MSDISTEERIKVAAAKVFTLHGLEGARMQDIADEANINKAMLHYYFRNKQQLFEIIFTSKVHQIFSTFHLIMEKEVSFEEKIRTFIDEEIDIISEFPALPLFVMMESRKNPELLDKVFQSIPLDMIRLKFKEILGIEVKNKRIREVGFDELMMNIMSLCIYPIIAAPVFQKVLQKSDVEYQRFIENRKVTIADMILKDIKYK